MKAPQFALSLVFAGSALLAGCQTTSHSDMSPTVVKAATPAEKAALLEQVKKLAGTWEMKDDKGNTMTAAVFTVSSNGSAVREVMMPGTDHEMTNMYTMDGDALLMTHYCAMGNQPHMKAHAGPKPNVIKFETAGVSNLNDANGLYMAEMTMTIVDNDHITAEWTHIQNAKRDQHTTPFEMTRKK